jgi:hypothetical protein
MIFTFLKNNMMQAAHSHHFACSLASFTFFSVLIALYLDTFKTLAYEYTLYSGILADQFDRRLGAKNANDAKLKV